MAVTLLCHNMSTTPTKIVLLDTHAILHRAYHALPDFSSPSGEPTGALYGVVTMVLKIAEELQPDHIVACYDLPKPTYRHDAYAGYKSGRSKTDDELLKQIKRSRELFQAFGIPIYEKEGFEADDVLGTIAHELKTDKSIQVIIASGDMDTLQCVDKKRVQVYTLKKGIKDTILYDEAAVKDRFGFPPKRLVDYKGLRGDPSDNIPGIRGIGDKTATELVVSFGSIEKIYSTLKKDEQALLDAGIKPRIINLLKEGEEEALFSKMLATIRTDAPVSFTIPETHWKQTAEPKQLLNLFAELGFRTLNNRIRQVFTLAEDVTPDQVASGVSEDDLQEAKILLWLLESDRTNATYEDIIDYGRNYFDTVEFTTIKKELERRAKDQELWSVFTAIEKPLIPVIQYLNTAGIQLDLKYLQTLSVQMHKELDALEKAIHAEAGESFNINSPKQMADVLYDTLGLKPKQQKKTATGQRSTRESELEKMKNDHPIITSILRYRELQKLVSTYIDNLPALVSDDGRLRSTFLQTGTTTGRFASRDPNLQNIPTRSEEGRAIRKGFVATSGHQLVAIDYSQIELRIAAILSEDPHLIEIFKNGEDVHAGVAARVFNVDQADVTSEMRRKAKVINFGILYGMGVNALRTNLGEHTTRNEAQEFLNAYFNTFTRLAEYLEETKHFARVHGYTKTMFGRRRHFPGINSGAPFVRAQAERMAINAPVQGTAADIIRMAMVEVYLHIQEQKKDSVDMVLQVHDELIFEVSEKSLETEIVFLRQTMEQVLADYDTHGVPLLADVSVGDNWGEMQKRETAK